MSQPPEGDARSSRLGERQVERLGERSISTAWEANAHDWVTWARTPGHDSYWRIHREAFLQIVPARAARALDVGCGEGRLSRDLGALGHRVTGLDLSPTLVAAARSADPDGAYVRGDAAALPFSNGTFDLVIAFMSLQDVDDMPAAVAELARVLSADGCICIAVVHPLNSCGVFQDARQDAPYVIEGSYLDPQQYVDDVERDGLSMRFVSAHYPLEAWFAALSAAGLHVEALRETTYARGQWSRVPLFLHLRAKRYPDLNIPPDGPLTT